MTEKCTCTISASYSIILHELSVKKNPLRAVFVDASLQPSSTLPAYFSLTVNARQMLPSTFKNARLHTQSAAHTFTYQRCCTSQQGKKASGCETLETFSKNNSICNS